MHVCRYESKEGSEPQIGLVDLEAGTVTELDELDAPSENLLRGDINVETLREAAGEETHSLDDVRLRAPIERPTNLIGIGLNYAGHAEESGYDIPDEPIFFAKSPSSINDPNGDVVITGTPASVGDDVVIEVEGIGTLENRVTES